MAKEEQLETGAPTETMNENQETDPQAAEPAAETNPSGQDEHAELQGLLEDARAKADDHWNQLLRANAELENTKRRARQDVENAHKYALEKFVQELLPVKDSLEMGLNAAGNTDSDVAARLKEGVELTLKMLSGALEKFAVREIHPLGDAFDPALHQAMSLQESAEHAPNTVIAVMQKGYQLNDRLIRPAMVVVSKAAAGEPAESGGQIDEKA